MPFGRTACAAAFLFGCVLGTLARAAAADRLILRNLDIVLDRTVVSLDEDGVVLDGPRPGGGTRVTWDEIERGKVAFDQERFDRLLIELGAPLYRIRQRIKNSDYAAASGPAEALYLKFADRKSQTAYLVCQATMWSRLATDKREAAIEPYLRCYELLRTRVAVSGNLPGSRRLNVDPATAMSPELAPVWFDAAAAKEELPKVQQAIRLLSQPRPEGVYVYYASLAIAAGERAEAEQLLRQLVTGDMVWWRKMVEAEGELRATLVYDGVREALNPHPSPLPKGEGAVDRHASLDRRANVLPEGEGTASSLFRRLSEMQDSAPRACRPLGLLLTGMAGVQCDNENDVRGGLLALLSLPAHYAIEQPELAAAGLYHAARALDKLKDGRGAAAVQRELTTRFPATHFGGLNQRKSQR